MGRLCPARVKSTNQHQKSYRRASAPEQMLRQRIGRLRARQSSRLRQGSAARADSHVDGAEKREKARYPGGRVGTNGLAVSGLPLASSDRDCLLHARHPALFPLHTPTCYPRRVPIYLAIALFVSIASSLFLVLAHYPSFLLLCFHCCSPGRRPLFPAPVSPWTSALISLSPPFLSHRLRPLPCSAIRHVVSYHSSKPALASGNIFDTCLVAGSL